jgi:hypothetical protein
MATARQEQRLAFHYDNWGSVGEDRATLPAVTLLTSQHCTDLLSCLTCKSNTLSSCGRETILERLRDMAKVTELVSGRAGTRTYPRATPHPTQCWSTQAFRGVKH